MLKNMEGFSRERLKLPGQFFEFGLNGSGATSKPDNFQIIIGILCAVVAIFALADAISNSYTSAGTTASTK
jgi:hypothetical protein